MNRATDWLPFVKIWTGVLKSGGRVGEIDPDEYDAVWEDVEDLKLEHVQAGARELRRLNIDGFVPTGGRLRQLAERARLDEAGRASDAIVLRLLEVKPAKWTDEECAEARDMLDKLARDKSL